MIPLALPTEIYGLSKDVRRRIARLTAPFLKEGASVWPQPREPALPVQETPGLIVLAGPSPALALEPHFHVYMPLLSLVEASLTGKVTPAMIDSALDVSLETPAGLLGILSPTNQMLVYPEHRQRRILNAVAERWRVLDGVGARYSVGSPEGFPLWEITTNLQYLLARGGCDQSSLTAPLPARGIVALLERLWPSQR